jgi:hypothetical protein
MRRYLEPVFAPASPTPSTPASDDTPSFSSRQQQQQQQQAAQDQSSRSGREAWAESGNPFSRRSQLSESFIPEPAAPRVPAFLPTSSRLSALA